MNNSKLIEKYFSNQLSEIERLEFNGLYTTDPEFKKEVDFLNNVKSVSEKEDDAQFKKHLRTYEAEFSTKKKRKSKQWLKPLYAVAAILLIALSINLFQQDRINETELFSTYFEPSKNVSVPIVRSETDESLLNNAFMAYSETNYEEALSLFQKAFENTQNSELLFYEGNTLLALGQTEKAIEKFKEHLNYEDQLTNRSYWYLALAYLKTNQLENAKDALKTLIDSGETFKKREATLLLKKIE